MRILNWNIQWGRGIDGRVDLARTAGVHAASFTAGPEACDVDLATSASDHQPVLLTLREN